VVIACRAMTWPKRIAVVASALGLAGVAWGLWIARRALPAETGAVAVEGLRGTVEIVRDRWGVPHIYANDDDDAYFGLGWATAQDRLFQMEMNRRLAQGRLSEVFGARTVLLDRLFRTMDFAGGGRRVLARARPEALSAAHAYAQGVNAYVRVLGRRLPPEFALLRIGFDEARAEDFAGILGFMAWRLNLSWAFDPLYERLVAKVGEERAAELFPYNSGGSPSVYPATATARPPQLSLFDLSPDAAALASFGPSLRASNNWVVGPRKSATGRPILCNDPHLAHGLPGVWYEAHLKTSTQDVIGVTIPGFPLVVIGHNRQIAWGMTNLMVDAADFFLEKIDAEGTRVLSRGEWTPLERRSETIRVRGGRPLTLEVRSTPHGPLVSDLLPGETRALSYEWNYQAASQACELDGFYALDRARSWTEFRAALSRLGSIAQNVVYADAKGHIGLQAAGAIPRLTGRRDGTRFRTGWDGSEDWDGFIPFDELPSVFDPPQGWLASANNPTLPAPSPYYISSQWEPVDRIRRIQELIREKDKLSVEDMERIQQDTTVVSAREIAALVVLAFATQPPRDDEVRAAIDLLRGWDGDMRADSAAATIFSVLYRRLFDETFSDELGKDLARAYRAQANVWAIMLEAALERHPRWFDRVDTPGVEGRDDVLRAGLEKSVDELRRTLGGEPRTWTWGRVHTLEFQHPLGRGSSLLGFYFNRGPFPVPGHNESVNKMEFGDEGFAVIQGPSMRQITDFSDLDRSVAVLPGGQSGIPSSPHYADLMALWLAGRYHPLLMDRDEIDQVVEGRLVLNPR
jgi:penicillin G amidase